MSSEFTYSPKSIDHNQFYDCPEDYKKYVKRILAVQAFAERCGACEMGTQLRLAPDPITRKSFARIVYDEASHAHMLYKILEKIGVNESEALQLAKSKNSKGKSTESLDGVLAVGNSENCWIDIVLNNMFLDRAGSHMVGNFSNSSFKPWAEACEKIYIDEQMHKAFGFKQLKRYIEEHNVDEELIQKIRQWYVHALNFFGPPNIRSQELLNYYGIKRQSNEKLRCAFIDEVFCAMKALGLHEIIDHGVANNYPFKIFAITWNSICDKTHCAT